MKPPSNTTRGTPPHDSIHGSMPIDTPRRRGGQGAWKSEAVSMRAKGRMGTLYVGESSRSKDNNDIHESIAMDTTRIHECTPSLDRIASRSSCQLLACAVAFKPNRQRDACGVLVHFYVHHRAFSRELVESTAGTKYPRMRGGADPSM